MGSRSSDPLLLPRARLFAAGSPLFVNHPTHRGHTPLHRHDFLELVLVASGHAVHRTLHGLESAGAGSLVLIHPGAWHAWEECRDLSLWNVCIAAEVLARELAWVGGDPGLARLLDARSSGGVATWRLDAEGQVACGRPLGELLRLHPGGGRLVPDQLGWLLILLGELGRRLGPRPGRAGVAVHPAVAACVARLEADPGRNWALDQLASGAGLDRAYFVRLFRRSLGEPPLRWLARRRCELAAVRLLTSDEPVAEIGRAVGYDDANHFARRFRSIFRQTPSDYRRQLPVPPAEGLDDDGVPW